MIGFYDKDRRIIGQSDYASGAIELDRDAHYVAILNGDNLEVFPAVPPRRKFEWKGRG